MSVVIETFLLCDKCSKSYGVDNRGNTAKEHRHSAKEEGWINVGSKDYCPDCKPAIKINKKNK